LTTLDSSTALCPSCEMRTTLARSGRCVYIGAGAPPRAARWRRGLVDMTDRNPDFARLFHLTMVLSLIYKTTTLFPAPKNMRTKAWLSSASQSYLEAHIIERRRCITVHPFTLRAKQSLCVYLKRGACVGRQHAGLAHVQHKW
jgi:hypothetical protein